MSGHSKWATTKRAKAVVDAKRGAIFTKLSKLISIAARKGGDPDTNFSLRMSIDKAKGVNMPKENIERAIKRGTGELGGNVIEELTYEAIGPSKTQFIVKCLTDNKNRSAAEVRHIFSKFGGALGAVAWNFEQKGVIAISREEIEAKKIDIEAIELDLIDAGAEDIKIEEEGVTIYTNPEDFQKTKNFLETKNITTVSAEIEYVAKERQDLTEEEKESVLKVIDELDDNEDVADYYTNANL